MMYPYLVVIYSFVARQVSIGQDAHILHDNHQRPNCANPFVTRQKSRANTKLTQISIWLLDTQNCSYWMNQLQILILSNDKIKLKTAFGRLSHMFLSWVLTSDVVTRVNDSTRLESRFFVTLTRLESRSAVSCDDSTRVTFFIKWLDSTHIKWLVTRVI